MESGLHSQKQHVCRKSTVRFGAIVLSVALLASFVDPVRSQGNGNAGGLPSIADRVATLERQVAALQSGLTAQANQSAQADAGLQAKLDAEASARSAADTALQSKLDAEAAARQSGDAALEQSLTAEATARAAADAKNLAEAKGHAAQLVDQLSGTFKSFQDSVTKQFAEVAGELSQHAAAILGLRNQDKAHDGALKEADGKITSHQAPIGTVMSFAGARETVPQGWMECNGAPLARAEYPELFAAIRTAWGDANDQNGADRYFRLPDLRGMFLRGVDGGVNRDHDRDQRGAQYQGQNQGDAVGSYQGDMLRSHHHNVNDPGHKHVDAGHGHSYTISKHHWERSDNANDRDVVKRDTYDEWRNTATGHANIQSAATGISIAQTGGSETRPLNANVVFIIRVK